MKRDKEWSISKFIIGVLVGCLFAFGILVYTGGIAVNIPSKSEPLQIEEEQKIPEEIEPIIIWTPGIANA